LWALRGAFFSLLLAFVCHGWTGLLSVVQYNFFSHFSSCDIFFEAIGQRRLLPKVVFFFFPIAANCQPRAPLSSLSFLLPFFSIVLSFYFSRDSGARAFFLDAAIPPSFSFSMKALSPTLAARKSHVVSSFQHSAFFFHPIHGSKIPFACSPFSLSPSLSIGAFSPESQRVKVTGFFSPCIRDSAVFFLRLCLGQRVFFFFRLAALKTPVLAGHSLAFFPFQRQK